MSLLRGMLGSVRRYIDVRINAAGRLGADSQRIRASVGAIATRASLGILAPGWKRRAALFGDESGSMEGLGVSAEISARIPPAIPTKPAAVVPAESAGAHDHRAPRIEHHRLQQRHIHGARNILCAGEKSLARSFCLTWKPSSLWKIEASFVA